MIRIWVLIFLCFALGIILAWWDSIFILSTVIIIVLFIYFIKQDEMLTYFLAIIMFLCGFVYYSLLPDIPEELPAMKNVEIMCRIKTYPVCDERKTSFIVQVDSHEQYLKKIKVSCYFKADLKKGDYIKIKGDLNLPQQATNPGQFNYAAYLAKEGIYYILSINSRDKLQLISPSEGITGIVNSFRINGEKAVNKVLKQEEAAVLLGMLLGKKDGLDQEQYEDFQQTGIVHLFAVSGLHVGFLIVLLGWITSLLALSPAGRFYLSLLVLLFYGTMVGWPVSVSRAVIMGVMGILAYYSGREKKLLDALAIAGFLILIIDPQAIFKISFQLSFLAAWGLVYIFPLIKDSFDLRRWYFDLLLVPLCAQIAVLPLIAYYFNLFTPVSLLSNILVTYLAGMTVILGFLAIIMASFPLGLSSIFIYPAGLLIKLILLCVNYCKIIPGAFVWVATPHICLLVFYYLGLLLFVFFLVKELKNRWFIVPTAMGLIFFMILLIPASFYNKGKLELVFLDVGQGDCIIIKTPGGEFLMVDGGGSDFYDVGKHKVLPYIHHRGIRSIDLLINTHPDKDHLGGVETVASDMKIRYIGLPASLFNSDKYSDLKRTATAKNIPFLGFSQGQKIKLEKDLTIKVLHPERENYSGQDYNDKSLVLWLKYQAFSVLLTGDITADSMRVLVEKGLLEKTTIVKIPHHGSKGSIYPDFYHICNPDCGIIQVGRNNNFGHPHPTVLKLLDELDIKVMRNDQLGAIIFHSDGKSYSCNGTIEGK